MSELLSPFEFSCSSCGDVHSGAPSFSYPAPVQFFFVPEEERASRIKLTEDLCTISTPEGEDTAMDYFIRATIDIPIIGCAEHITWGVWVSQSLPSFEDYVLSFEEDQSGMTSVGWLTITFPTYVTTDPDQEFENVACDVHWGSKSDRPTLVVRECDHPIFKDQREGVTFERAVAMVEQAMH